MKLFNYVYENQKELETFVQETFTCKEHMLIQLFCGEINPNKIQMILDYLHCTLPNSAIIGSTTAGEIYQSHIQHQSIVLSFCILEKSQARVYYFPVVDAKSGKSVANEIVKKNTKVCIAFAETLRGGDSESFLKAFNTVAPHLIVAGGNAGDDFTFTQTLIIHGNSIENEGIVIATIQSNVLQVHHDYSFGWTQIGKEMRVSKCDNNTIYALDGVPIIDVYKHYFGEEILQNLPTSTIAFPLVNVCDYTEVCRSMIAVNPDHSFVFAGHFQEGDKVRFAIGNIEEIMQMANTLQRTVHRYVPEAVFIYSCSVRNLFLKEHLHYEFKLLEEIAPTVGFFTYGEFFHSNAQNHLLNVTTTTLCLSESLQEPKQLTILPHPVHTSVLKSLTHLVNTTQDELDESINFLNQYKIAMDQSAIFSKMDKDGTITYVNDAFCTITGYTREEIIGFKHSMFRAPDVDPRTYKAVWESLHAKTIWRGILPYRNKSGEKFYIKSMVMPLFDEEGALLEYISSSMDITEIILKDKIIQEQWLDELTGLGNRQALFHEIRLDDREKLLVLINLVGFSEINDYLGYDVGDELLKHIGALLSHSFDENHQVAFRINGDEFALLLKENDTAWKKLVYEKVQRIIQHLEKYIFNIQGYEVAVRFNVGVAQGCLDDIYMQSHVALKEAKRSNQIMVSYDDTEALKTQTEHNIQIIQKIKHAIENDRIIPFFQGIYDNKLQKITKYEVLMRLQEEDGSYLAPYYFLEQAKKTRLYEKLTKIIIMKSFAYFQDKPYDFSINLTKGDILSNSVKECLYENIRKYQCGHRVILEIVESEGIENFEEIAAFIKEVKCLGCKIAIDDFGTGYSNFAYLAQLLVDFIKIDGSLIKEIDTNRTTSMTVETIISFAHKMNYEIVAEFVDKPSVQKKLERLHVDFSQGYLFSKPSASIEH